MMKYIYMLSIIFLFNLVYAETIYVKPNAGNPIPPYYTEETAARYLKDAVPESAHGDTIMLLDGTHVIQENITFLNQVDLKSSNGPDYTIIDGLNDISARLNIKSNVDIEGLTFSRFSNNAITYGDSSSYQIENISISNCYFYNNLDSTIIQPGIFNELTINSCIFSNNTHTFGSFGRDYNIYVIDTDFIKNNGNLSSEHGIYFTNCNFTANNSTLFQGYTTLDSCLISSNSARLVSDNYYGYELNLINCHIIGHSLPYSLFRAYSDSLSIDNCIFEGNKCIFGDNNIQAVTNSSFINNNNELGRGRFIKCVISNNISSAFSRNSLIEGELIQCMVVDNHYTNGTIVRSGTASESLFARNKAQQHLSSNYTFYNCTITENYPINTTSNWPAIYAGTLRNSIVWNNNGDLDANVVDHKYTLASDVDLSYPNYTNDPLFIDTDIGDYRLRRSSPAANSGYETYVISDFDLLGNQRQNGFVDLGAYEQTDEPILIIDKIGDGQINVESGVYPEGTNLIISAESIEPWQFLNWSDDIQTSTLNITLSNDLNLVATFVRMPLVDISIVGNGSVNITNGYYNYNEQVDIEASGQGAKWVFMGYSGDITSDTPIISKVLTNDLSLTATFGLLPDFDLYNYYETTPGDPIIIDATPEPGNPANNYSYKWFLNGTRIPNQFGGGQSSFSIDGNAVNNGNWMIIVENSVGATTNSFGFFAASDSDQDSIYDHYETDTGIFVDAQDTGSDPYNADSDGDTINDGVEVNDLGTDPNKVDTDDDGIDDNVEINVYSTNPTKSDTNDDGFPDGVMASLSYNPLFDYSSLFNFASSNNNNSVSIDDIREKMMDMKISNIDLNKKSNTSDLEMTISFDSKVNLDNWSSHSENLKMDLTAEKTNEFYRVRLN